MAPRNKPDAETERRYIQARLHSKTPGGREAAAIEAYDEIKTESKWDDRRFVTEACIALKMFWNDGWRPPTSASEIASEILDAVKAMKHTVQTMNRTAQMFSQLDLSSLKTQPGWDNDLWEEATTAMNDNAADLLGTSKKWVDPDDE